MNSVVVSSPARVSLFGEYSRLVGHSITATINDLQILCNVSIGSNKFHQFSSENLKQKKIVKDVSHLNDDWQDYISAPINALIQRGYIIPYLDINISSNIPMRTGLASSSSLIVCVIHGISTLLKLNLPKETIAEYAYFAESTLLGIPCSRMDHYSCSLGGIQYINHLDKNANNIIYYKLPINTKIIVAETNTTKSTHKIISKVIANFQKGKKRVIKHINVEKELINNAKDFFESKPKDLSILGNLLNLAHKSYQNNLRSSSNLHDLLCVTAINAGAYGAKITGGGFGGCVFALTTTMNQDKVLKELKKVSKKIYVSPVSYKGTYIIKR